MQAGTRIGHFELQEMIGRGGMGEVWRARDTRLDREVALKTLPAAIAADPERTARLATEARVLASLNHAGIGAIHGLEQQAGQHWLVLELVEGETLEDRLGSGRIALDEAIDIALQVADALEAAHARDIVHCDLKPANIKLTADGRVKVLDFGIARSLKPQSQALQTTLTTPPDAASSVAGTPTCMSPEQTRGEPPGVASDIWAFGVLLYRMLTGRLPFTGTTTADTLAQVLQTSPDLSLLPEDLPDPLIRLVRRCLEKEPRRRIRHAGDLRILLEDGLAAAHARRPAAPWHARWPAIAALGLLALAGAGITAWLAAGGGNARGMRGIVRTELSFALATPGPQSFGTRDVAISRDGSRIAVATYNRLWVRALDTAEPVAVDIHCLNPFFSPDAAWIGCANEPAGLVKVPSVGGSAIPLTGAIERPSGAVWTERGTILFTTSEGLFSVDEQGGKPQLLLRPDAVRDERLYAWPQLLPGGRSLLLTVLPAAADAPPRIVQLDLDDLKVSPLLAGGSSAQHVAGDLLVYASASGLHAVRFDRGARRVHGEPVPIPGLALEFREDNGAAGFALSDNGTLVALRPRSSGQRILYWRDAAGMETPLALPPGNYNYPRVSPDGRRIALDLAGRNNRDIWVFDLDRASLDRVTSDPAEETVPQWSSDGRRVFFTSNRGGTFDIFSQAADGSGNARAELAVPGSQMLTDVTADGQLLVVEDFRRLGLIDPVQRSLQPLLHEGAEFWLGSVSPDGRWIAYESREAGDAVEIFLRPFPAVTGRREKISIAGGRYPLWGPAGSNALYFVQPGGAVMRVQLQLSPALKVGAVTRLFDWEPPLPRITGMPYDVSPVDGRFLLSRRPTPGELETQAHASLVLNWFEELRGLFAE